MRRALTVATARRRQTPRPQGPCATGCIVCTALAMMHLLVLPPSPAS
jgi:hypothetical protein